MYYSAKLSPVERERLRERDREARAQITYEAEQRGSQDVVNSGPIFGEIVRVHPESDDFERQQIERKLGRFEDVKHLLDHDNNLFGIDGQPPPSPAPPSNIGKAALSLSSHVFKKPNSCLQSQPNRSSHHHSHHGSHRSSSQWGGFYTGQPMKNCSSTSNDVRSSSSMVSMKGLSPLTTYTIANSASYHHSSSTTRSASQDFSNVISNSNSHNSSSSSGSKIHQALKHLPKLHCEARDIPHCCSSGSGSGSSSQANVENILDEMTLGFRTPLTAIAATPRKEMESKFNFSTVSGKMELLSPVKTPIEKSCKMNSSSSILGPSGRSISFLPTSVFKPNHIRPGPFISSSNLPSSFSSVTSNNKFNLPYGISGSGKSGASAACIDNGISSSSNNVANNNNASTSTLTSSQPSSDLPTLQIDLILSEDSNDDDSDDSEEENNVNEQLSDDAVQKKSESVYSIKAESVLDTVMTPEEVRESSSSDSESDSVSGSEDSSSDSPSPSALPLTVPPDPEDNSQGWSLKSFLPQPIHGNLTPTPHIARAGDTDSKLKTDDWNSPGGTMRRSTENASATSSDSDDADIVQSPRVVSKCKLSHARNVATQSNDDDSTDEDDLNRRKYNRGSRGSSSWSQISDDSDQLATLLVNNSSSSNTINTITTSAPTHTITTAATTTDTTTTSAATNNSSNSNNVIAATAANNASANNNVNLTVVGVVKPHQRKPPSPQVFSRNLATGDKQHFTYVMQHSSLPLSPTPEPQFELTSHADAESALMGTMNLNRLTDSFNSRTAATKTVEEPVAQQAEVGGKVRKLKSPALLSAGETPEKRKRGRKRTSKVPDISDSDNEVVKVKVPERRKPGRPPLRRPDHDDVDWNINSTRRKASNKFHMPWSGCERPCPEKTRYSLNTDSDADPPSASVKPTARVPPAIKKKDDGRCHRDSSCESSKNDSDFNAMPEPVIRNSVKKAEDSPPKLDVEGIAVQDKKKNDTLRKLFSRREEGGGKGGGKGKGGKGKCGVIVMESEAERRMQERSLSPVSNLHHGMQEHLTDISRLEISELQSQMLGNNLSELPAAVQMSCGENGSSMARQLNRLPEVDPNISPAKLSLSAELPELTYKENGKPSLMCRIDLSKIPYILAKKRPEEVRAKSELNNKQMPTQQQQPELLIPSATLASIPLGSQPLNDDDSDDSSISKLVDHRNRIQKKHSKQKTKSLKRKQQPPSPPHYHQHRHHYHHAREESPPLSLMFSSTAHTPTVDPESDSLSSDSERRKKITVCGANQWQPKPSKDSLHTIMNSCYSMAVNNMRETDLCIEQQSQERDSWDNCNNSRHSCSSSSSRSRSSSPCSESQVACRDDKYNGHRKRQSKHHQSERKRRKLRVENNQRYSNLVSATSLLMHVPGTNHERNAPPEPSLSAYQLNTNQMNITELVRPVVPSHHGIYYSYLEHKVSEEMNSESDTVSPNVYLMEAKRLKHAADTERDQVAQGMQYLEAILSFVLTGHVLERRSQTETASSMYSETLKLIVFISKKFRALCSNTIQSNIPNKIAILSLRCESILNLKLYMMREMEVKIVHSTVTDYFNKPIPADACLVANQGIPSPRSPSPSPASSVGSNSSGYSSGVPQCIVVPFDLHTALQKQHNFYSNLIASFNYWEEADKLIFSGGNKDFFIELDRFCGPLTLHSSLNDLVHYVRVGIQRLKAIILSHHHHYRHRNHHHRV